MKKPRMLLIAMYVVSFNIETIGRIGGVLSV